MKNPVDILRYVKGVVFPGKEFMIENMGFRAKNKDQRSKTERKTHHHIITSSHQNFGGCGIHIVGGLPYGRW